MLKVVNITMEGRYGGPHAFIAAIAEKLKGVGVETVVIFPCQNSDYFLKKLDEKGIQVKRLSLHRLTKDKIPLIKYVILFISELFSLYKLIVRSSADIVHCNHSWQFKGVLAAKLARKPVVWTIHETSTPLFVNIIFKFLALHFCDAFITAGERVRTCYLSDERFSKKQIMEIQAPVDTSVFDPEKIKEDGRIADYPGLKIVTVGNINPLKGIEYFIEMASILNEEYNDLVFFVVGPHFESQKYYSEKICRMAKNLEFENVHFYGPTDDIASVLKAADIYVCASISEASPISVWEAMSMAKPIASSDVGDVARFIENGENGFVVPIKGAVAMAEKVGLLIGDEKLRKRFGRKARDVAVRYLDVSICAKKHAQFYREIVKMK